MDRIIISLNQALCNDYGIYMHHSDNKPLLFYKSGSKLRYVILDTFKEKLFSQAFMRFKWMDKSAFEALFSEQADYLEVPVELLKKMM